VKKVIFMEFSLNAEPVAYFVGDSRLSIINDIETMGKKYDHAREISEDYIRSQPNIRFLDEGIEAISSGGMTSFALLLEKK